MIKILIIALVSVFGLSVVAPSAADAKRPKISKRTAHRIADNVAERWCSSKNKLHVVRGETPGAMKGPIKGRVMRVSECVESGAARGSFCRGSVRHRVCPIYIVYDVFWPFHGRRTHDQMRKACYREVSVKGLSNGKIKSYVRRPLICSRFKRVTGSRGPSFDNFGGGNLNFGDMNFGGGNFN